VQQPLRWETWVQQGFGFSCTRIICFFGRNLFLGLDGRKENQEFEKDKVINGVKIYFVN
jgi:hypothetical protein